MGIAARKRKKTKLSRNNFDLRANPNAIKHGCVDCVYRGTLITKFPCSDCDAKNGKWYYWTDRTKEKEGKIYGQEKTAK